MKITAISDLHGNLINIDPCDILLICGDLSPLDIQRDHIKMTKWIFNDFQEWLLRIPADRVIMTPGNHDFWFEMFVTKSQTYLFDKLTILIDGESNIIESRDGKTTKLKIYGTPWCRTCGKWAYTPGDDKLNDLYSSIPHDVDILITHDAPQIGKVGNILDDPTYTEGRPCGNIQLANAIISCAPKYTLCGHIHSGDHSLTEIPECGIKLANCSILGEDYSVVHKPLTFEI